MIQKSVEIDMATDIEKLGKRHEGQLNAIQIPLNFQQNIPSIKKLQRCHIQRRNMIEINTNGRALNERN